MKSKLFLFIFLSFVFIFGISLVSASVEHTTTTDTICDGNTCTKTLYSGIRNVYEDNEWKRVENARSLKDKGFNVVYLENDVEFPIEITDFNYTSISVKLNPKGINIFNKNVPLRVWSNNYTKAEQFRQDVADGKKQSKGKAKDYKEKMDKSFEQEIGFNLLNQEEKRTLDFRMGKVLEFGFNSTTITLKYNESENINDVYVKQDGPTTNFDNSDLLLRHYPGNNRRFYLMFNISSIPVSSIINNTNITFFQNFVGGGGFGGDLTIDSYYVKNTTWKESLVTWNTQPCGTGWNDIGNCNFSILDNKEAVNQENITYTFNITDGFKEGWKNNKSVFSLGYKFHTEGGAQLAIFWESAETGNATTIPKLTTTYTISSDTTPPDVTKDSCDALNTSFSGFILLLGLVGTILLITTAILSLLGEVKISILLTSFPIIISIGVLIIVAIIAFVKICSIG